MTSEAVHRYRMVVALDLSQYSDVVIEHALDLAARHDACDIHVVVVHEPDATIEDEKRQLLALTRDELQTFRAAEHDWQVRLHLRTGDIAGQIGALAGEAQADVIVIGRFGRHRASWRTGSVTERVLARAPCSTLVVQLTDQAVETEPDCPECVAVRKESNGENWFCAAHHAPDRDSLFQFPKAPSFTDGGLMW
jgi:nucleotide-binding universal stress UspA family protein